MIKPVISCILLAQLSFAVPADAETGTSRDWAWSTDEKDFYFAITTNSKDYILGQYCYIGEGTCFYIVGMDIYCEPGNAYPALMNSDKGADHLVLKCVHEFEGHNILAVGNFEKFDELVRTASRIGIVIPIEDDKFKMIRFSLLGSAVAIEHMRDAAKKANRHDDAPAKSKSPDEELM